MINLPLFKLKYSVKDITKFRVMLQTRRRNLHICSAHCKEQINIQKILKRGKKSKKKITQDSIRHLREEEIQLIKKWESIQPHKRSRMQNQQGYSFSCPAGGHKFKCLKTQSTLQKSKTFQNMTLLNLKLQRETVYCL